MPTQYQRFLEDYTGVNPNNLVQDEPYTLIPLTPTLRYRAFVPQNGAIFAESLLLIDQSTNQPLIRGQHYMMVELLQEQSIRAGKDIYWGAIILDRQVSQQLSSTYQVLGGRYQKNMTQLFDLYNLTTIEPTLWQNVENKPLYGYPPAMHLQSVRSITDWGPMVSELRRLTNALTLRYGPAFEELITYVQSLQYQTGVTIDGPVSLDTGATGIYVISNYDSFTVYSVTADEGSVSSNLNTIYYTAPNTEGVAGFTVNGRVIPIEIVAVNSGGGGGGGGGGGSDGGTFDPATLAAMNTRLLAIEPIFGAIDDIYEPKALPQVVYLAAAPAQPPTLVFGKIYVVPTDTQVQLLVLPTPTPGDTLELIIIRRGSHNVQLTRTNPTYGFVDANTSEEVQENYELDWDGAVIAVSSASATGYQVRFIR